MTMRANMRNLISEHRMVALAALITTLVVAVYWQSYARMIGMWSHASYQYGWLVYPIAFYMLWRKRHMLSAIRLKGSTVGVAFTALVVVAWIVANSIGVQAIEFLAATLLIFGAFWAIAGRQAVLTAAFPLLLLLAAVPVGDILIEPLMESTATIASTLLYAAGVPVYRDGMLLTLPGGSFEVARVCSGLRFLLAGTMASLAYAHLSYASFRKRTIFVATAAIVLVIANGFRAFVVMLVASATEMRAFAGEDHVIFGMVLFVVVFTVLVYFGERFSDAARNEPHLPESTRNLGEGNFPTLTASIVSLLVLAGPAFQYVKAQEPVPSVSDAQLPELPGCLGPAEWNRDWSPEFRGADQLHRGSYACTHFESSVYVATYKRQAQGKELVSSANRVWPYDWRRYVDETSVSLALESGSATVHQALVRGPERSRLIWYWYQSGDSVTASELEVKVRAAVHALGLRPREASVVAIAISSERDIDPLALGDEMEVLARTMMSWNRER